jgi:hypothetical protein
MVDQMTENWAEAGSVPLRVLSFCEVKSAFRVCSHKSLSVSAAMQYGSDEQMFGTKQQDPGGKPTKKR